MIRALLIAGGLALAGCAAQPGRQAGDTLRSGETPLAGETLVAGETMGSAWTVKLVGALPQPAEQLRAGIQAQFEAVNQALSTYRPESALSVFNRDDSGEWQDIDPELAFVMNYALSLAEASGGAYDITVGPLVNLWGFGPDPATQRVPDAAAIARAREHVGWRKVEVDEPRRRARKQPGVRVDLSSLGKGRGVDRVAAYLDAQGVTNYLIDLSGKLRARGRNASGSAWRVAIEQPAADVTNLRAGAGTAVVALHDSSVATAGDYRRFFEVGGRHYSHIIDPRTGEPVTHRTASSTALATSCMEADAWATVLMVMPPDEALSLADARGLTAMLIGRDRHGLLLLPSAAWRARPPL